MLAFAQQGPTTDYFPGRYRRSRTKGAKSQSPMAFHRHPPQSRTPDVVEFAVSPQVGQAVLAFARFYSSSGPKFRAGRRAPPAPPAKLSPSKGMAQPIFPATQKLRGDIRSSEIARSCQWLHGWRRDAEACRPLAAKPRCATSPASGFSKTSRGFRKVRIRPGDRLTCCPSSFEFRRPPWCVPPPHAGIGRCAPRRKRSLYP